MKHQDLERHIGAGEIDRVVVSRDLSNPTDKGKFRLFAYGDLLPPSTVNLLETARAAPRLFRDLETAMRYLLEMGCARFEVETMFAGAEAADVPGKAAAPADWLADLADDVPLSGWISALAWKRRQESLSSLDDEAWLHVLLLRGDEIERQGIRCEPVEDPPSHPLSGNIVVRDAMLGRDFT